MASLRSCGPNLPVRSFADDESLLTFVVVEAQEVVNLLRNDYGCDLRSVDKQGMDNIKKVRLRRCQRLIPC